MAKHDSFGTTVFIWEGMRLIEERRGSAIISYVYEPDSYVPLARLDAEGERTEQGGLGTTQDVRQPQTSKTIAASASQKSATGQKHPNYSQQSANDTLEASYWQALNPKGTAQNTGTDCPSANAKLCEVYYFHTDQVGLPEELSNAQGQIIWQAQYKTWGSTVEERWEARRLHGAKVQGETEGDIPQGARQEQNLRFQGQYLDRETGLHYNTFRYYDADIGRFISP
ncbi:RHS repeat domain-containing protein, partial [Paracidovorax sp. MALMAid1276]|uniref:RHS repeat domain-containing protein n=1 Tax=Paracidovorax sp. MALMAid1276 TaxID=3411631 RepID=UPI003B99B22D